VYTCAIEMRKSDIELEKKLILEIAAQKAAVEVLSERAQEYKVPDTSRWGPAVYNPREILPLDGNPNNKAFRNLEIVCPVCYAHIRLSRFSTQDIWLLKTRGLSNAEIGRLLDLSRERVRQLLKKYEAEQRAELTALMEADISDLVKKAEREENRLLRLGRLKRRIDRRTKKKRIIAELDKLRAKEA